MPAAPDGVLTAQAPTASVSAAPPADPDPARATRTRTPAVVRTMPGQSTLSRSVAGVRTDRLPQIGVAAETQPVAPRDTQLQDGPDDGSPAGVQAGPSGTLPRWQRSAIAIEPDGRPLIGLVLLDLANDPESEAAILALPMPITVALPPFAEDAPRRARAYAAAGHEVVLTLDEVPGLARASDLEVLFDSWLTAFPDVIGVIDTQAADARRARSLAPELIPILRDLGLGLIAPERGLSPLLNAARGGGVAEAGLYRTLDGGDMDTAALGRILDRVAFEARRQGRLAVVGRVDHAATRAAVAAWLSPEAAAGRAGQVQTVPVGVLLRAP
jgi:uncharacterized protein